MTQRPGSWQLDKVKAKLGREQVERESAASARYRQEEEKNKVAEKTSSSFLVLPLLFVGCVLSFLILVCFYFVNCVVVFCKQTDLDMKKGPWQTRVRSCRQVTSPEGEGK